MRRRTRLAALVGVLLLALTACGLTAQGSPQRVDTGTIAENGPLPSVRRVGVVEIYLLRDERLVSVVRSGRTGQDALSLLAAGPTPVEAAAGIGNALPPQPLRFVGEQEERDGGGRVTEAFAALSGRSQLLAVAQLVGTVTDLCCATQVRVLLDGRVVALPTDIGLTERPVLRRPRRRSSRRPPSPAGTPPVLPW